LYSDKEDRFSAKHLKMINETKILELIKRQKETGLTITAFCVNAGQMRLRQSYQEYLQLNMAFG
jgi:hypothetical protein